MSQTLERKGKNKKIMENAKFQSLLINLTEKKKNSKIQLESQQAQDPFFNSFFKV